METSSWFLTSLLLSGLVNALSAIPMSRFNSNKMFDLKVLTPRTPPRPTPHPTPHTLSVGRPTDAATFDDAHLHRAPPDPAARPRRPDAPAPPSHPLCCRCQDLKANGFTFGGTGLTCMCLYIAWWFSGDYPAFLLPFDIPIWIFWALVCVGTTANWEVMLQQNFEANERSGNKFAKVGC